MALFTSILAFAGSVTNALATAAPNARRETDEASRFVTSGARAAAEAVTRTKQRIDAASRAA